MSAGLTAAWALTGREFRRFLRQPMRIIAAIVTPAIIWVFLASGLARAIDGEGSFTLYLLPGMATLTVVFGSIFTAISLIEDRHEGFLQGVLVSPTPRWSIVLAKAVGGGLISTAQGAVLLIGAPLLGATPGPVGIVLALAALAAIGICIGAIGVAGAWWVDSSQGFHAIMNTVLMPMWLLSGAVFPLATSAGWLRWAMLANPLTWASGALRDAMGIEGQLPGPMWLTWLITLLMPIVGVALALRVIAPKDSA